MVHNMRFLSQRAPARRGNDILNIKEKCVPHPRGPWIQEIIAVSRQSYNKGEKGEVLGQSLASGKGKI
jgi:hypothetical protein